MRKRRHPCRIDADRNRLLRRSLRASMSNMGLEMQQGPRSGGDVSFEKGVRPLPRRTPYL